MRPITITTETLFSSPIITEYRTDKTLLEVKDEIENQMLNQYVYIPNKKEGTLAVIIDKIVSIRITDTITIYMEPK